MMELEDTSLLKKTGRKEKQSSYPLLLQSDDDKSEQF